MEYTWFLKSARDVYYSLIEPEQLSETMTMDPITLVFEAAYLHARRLVGMPLSERETNRLGMLRAMLSGEGRRQFLRLRIDRFGTLAHGSQKMRARVVNLSVEGCLLEVPEMVDEGSDIHLTLESEKIKRVFTAKVVRREAGSPQRIGIRFTAIPLELRLANRAPSLVDALDAAGA